jgi:hypothetical protein
MKRLVNIAIIISLLSGCSSLPISIPFLQSPTPTSPPQPTATPFALPASNTPDLFVINTAVPTSTSLSNAPLSTETAFPTFTPTFRSTITLEPIPANLFTPSPNIFLSVQKSTNQLVWGSTCEGARSIRFTTQVMPVRRLRFVTLWYRLQDKYSGRNTDWGGGAILSDNDQGTYFYDLQLNQISSYRFYEDAWFQYQLVASTITRRVLGRSVVSRNEISLTHCTVFNP